MSAVFEMTKIEFNSIAERGILPHFASIRWVRSRRVPSAKHGEPCSAHGGLAAALKPRDSWSVNGVALRRLAFVVPQQAAEQAGAADTTENRRGRTRNLNGRPGRRFRQSAISEALMRP
jgi:hypothetical protein